MMCLALGNVLLCALVCAVGPYQPSDGLAQRDRLVEQLRELAKIGGRIETGLLVSTFAPADLRPAASAPATQPAPIPVIQQTVFRVQHWDRLARLERFAGQDWTAVQGEPRLTCAWDGTEWQEAGEDDTGPFLQIHPGIRLTFETDCLGLFNPSEFPMFGNGTLREAVERGRVIGFRADGDRRSLRLSMNDKETTILEVHFSDKDGLRVEGVIQDVFGDPAEQEFAGKHKMRTAWRVVEWEKSDGAWFPKRAEREFFSYAGQALQISKRPPHSGKSVFERLQLKHLAESPGGFALPRIIGQSLHHNGLDVLFTIGGDTVVVDGFAHPARIPVPPGAHWDLTGVIGHLPSRPNIAAPNQHLERRKQLL